MNDFKIFHGRNIYACAYKEDWEQAEYIYNNSNKSKDSLLNGEIFELMSGYGENIVLEHLLLTKFNIAAVARGIKNYKKMYKQWQSKNYTIINCYKGNYTNNIGITKRFRCGDWCCDDYGIYRADRSGNGKIVWASMTPIAITDRFDLEYTDGYKDIFFQVFMKGRLRSKWHEFIIPSKVLFGHGMIGFGPSIIRSSEIYNFKKFLDIYLYLNDREMKPKNKLPENGEYRFVYKPEHRGYLVNDKE